MDTSSFGATVTSLAGVVSSNVMIVGYALLTLVAGIAFVLLVKEVLGMYLNGAEIKRNERINKCLIVLGLCIVAAFLPMIVNGIATLAGTGVDLGSVSNGGTE